MPPTLLQVFSRPQPLAYFSENAFIHPAVKLAVAVLGAFPVSGGREDAGLSAVSERLVLGLITCQTGIAKGSGTYFSPPGDRPIAFLR